MSLYDCLQWKIWGFFLEIYTIYVYFFLVSNNTKNKTFHCGILEPKGICITLQNSTRKPFSSKNLGDIFSSDIHPVSTIYIDPILGQCCATVCDAGPTLTQNWVSVSCLLASGVSHAGESPTKSGSFLIPCTPDCPLNWRSRKLNRTARTTPAWPLPSKHRRASDVVSMFGRCHTNVWPSSATTTQHWYNIGFVFYVY